MSLNGLDDARVKEASEAAANEPGGWFLLKYASRDEVELLGRGNGGIVELRNNIAQYEEPSPLFGFLRYKRRNVLIKYLPDDCSRLVQARVTVHFNALNDHFAPIDTTFDIAAAKDLKDTTLSAACSLHAQPPGSTSSSTSSLRRRRLMEIAEEEEEEEARAKRRSVEKDDDDTPASPPSPSQPPVTLNSDLARSPEQSRFASSTEPPAFEGVPRPASPAKSLGRLDLDSYFPYPYSKPKVKLGPRPSIENAGRPRTSAGNDRPVANLPAGVKMFRKNSKKGPSHDKENQIDEEPEQQLAVVSAADIPIPDIPFAGPAPVRPVTSSGVSVKSAAAATFSMRQNAMTPEKARLMKAMQLREKRKKAASEAKKAEAVPVVPTPDVPEEREAGAEPEDQDTADARGGQEQEVEPSSGRAGRAAPSENGSEVQTATSKADSGVDVVSSLAVADHASEDTQTDSHPASPIGASSEIGDSTKASSLSESTDETVQGNSEQKWPMDEEDDDEDEDEEDEDEQDEEHDTPEDITERPTDEEEEGPAAVRRHVPAEVEQEPEIAQAAPVEEAEDAEPTKAEEPQPADSREEEVSEESKPDEFETPQETPEEPISIPASKLASTEAEGGAGEDEPPSSPPLQTPESKFSTRDLGADMKAEQAAPVSGIVNPTEVALEEKRPPVIAKDDVDDETRLMDVRRSRKLDPIRTDLDQTEGGRTETNSSDDEDLLDELQTATVQEARSMLVSKSPMNPVFPSSPPRQTPGDGPPSPRIVRTVSNPLRGPPTLGPGDVPPGSARAVSPGAAYLRKVSQQSSNASLSSSKSNIGSSISQRIKALEMLSANGGGPAAAPGQQRAERPSSMFFSVRKSSIRDPSRSPSVAERANPHSRNHTPSPPQSRESSPETSRLGFKERSGSMANRLSMFEGGMMPRGRPDSIQVTARIVRDPAQPYPRQPEARATTTDFGPLDLKQSPLVVDLQKPPYTSPSALGEPVEISSRDSRETIQERRERRRSQSQDGDDDQSRRRSSLTIVRDFVKSRRGSIRGSMSPSADNLASPGTAPTPSISPSRPPSTHQTSGLVRRLSISSRRSSISRDRDPAMPMSPSNMTDASGSGEDRPGSVLSMVSDKKSGGGKSNRTSRFIRRLSNTISSGRKNMAHHISPTVAEEDAAELAAASYRAPVLTQPSIVAFMGDVNVQFPDNLLWKRRSMSLDSQGFLILSAMPGGVVAPTAPPPTAGGSSGIKRYHLSDFRPPYTPEMEVQELPNSVCLDFVEGSGLQIACEDRAGQSNVLQILQDAHRSHASFGQ